MVRNLIYAYLIIISLCFCGTIPRESSDQAKYYHSSNSFLFNEINESKYVYVYDLNGEKTISKNYLKNGRLVSETSYRSFKNKNIFIFNKKCLNVDCY